nr:MAG TPA: hypothetical protein [Caudoviricetes sp.]
MKKKVNVLGTEESEKALNMLQNCLKPEALNFITFSKENIGYETVRKISFCIHVDKNQYKQLKAYAQAADAIENADIEFYEENSDAEPTPIKLKLPENVKDYLEHQRALLLTIANHEDCEK